MGDEVAKTKTKAPMALLGKRAEPDFEMRPPTCNGLSVTAVFQQVLGLAPQEGGAWLLHRNLQKASFLHPFTMGCAESKSVVIEAEKVVETPAEPKPEAVAAEPAAVEAAPVAVEPEKTEEAPAEEPAKEEAVAEAPAPAGIMKSLSKMLSSPKVEAPALEPTSSRGSQEVTRTLARRRR